jgi:hypothetical protein
MKTELEEHESSLDKEEKVLKGIRDGLKGKVPALLSFCSNGPYWTCTAVSPSQSLPPFPNSKPPTNASSRADELPLALDAYSDTRDIWTNFSEHSPSVSDLL